MNQPNISAHITYHEGTYSETAQKFDIDNTPNKVELLNMQFIAEEIFEPMRILFGEPILVTSFFRCRELNYRLSGSLTSDHLTGSAMDLIVLGSTGYTNADIYNYIKDNCEFNQLIWEKGNNKNPAWVHIGYRRTGTNKQQILRIK